MLNQKQQRQAKEMECIFQQTSPQTISLRHKIVDKYQSSNLSKTFLMEYVESSSDQDKKTEMIKHQQIRQVPRRSRKSKLLTQLAPLVQAQSTVVYHRPTTQQLTLQQESFIEVEDVGEKTEESSVGLQKIQKQAVNQFQKISQPQEEAIVLGVKEKQFLLFEDDSQSNTNKSSQHFIQLPTSKKMLTQFYSSSSQKDKSGRKQTGSSNKKHRKNTFIHRTIDLISNDHTLSVKKILSEPLKQNTTLELILNRNKDGFNMFWPQFYLQFQSQTTPLIAAKKVSSKPTATYIISTNPSNFQQNSEYYLGKIKSSLLGDINNLFGQGLSPDSAKDLSQVPRQVLATIVYSKLASSKSKPRQFQVYVKKPQYRYYLNFDKVSMYEQQIDLSELYKQGQNHLKIDRYYNKKPVFDEDSQAFRLNFRGKVECSSIKNFILQKEPNGQDLMMFGKVNDSKFNVEISYPLSPLVGFAVALTSFDSRILLGD